MGVTKQKQMEEMESPQSLKDRNLDKNGEFYLNCRECDKKLKAIEKFDDICMSCKLND